MVRENAEWYLGHLKERKTNLLKDCQDHYFRNYGIIVIANECEKYCKNIWTDIATKSSLKSYPFFLITYCSTGKRSNDLCLVISTTFKNTLFIYFFILKNLNLISPHSFGISPSISILNTEILIAFFQISSVPSKASVTKAAFIPLTLQ